jgi:hypothetical protein
MADDPAKVAAQAYKQATDAYTKNQTAQAMATAQVADKVAAPPSPYPQKPKPVAPKPDQFAAPVEQNQQPIPPVVETPLSVTQKMAKQGQDWNLLHPETPILGNTTMPTAENFKLNADETQPKIIIPPTSTDKYVAPVEENQMPLPSATPDMPLPPRRLPPRLLRPRRSALPSMTLSRA